MVSRLPVTPSPVPEEKLWVVGHRPVALLKNNSVKLARQYCFRNVGHLRDESVGVRWKIGRLHRFVVDGSVTDYQTVPVTFKLVQTFQI